MNNLLFSVSSYVCVCFIPYALNPHKRTNIRYKSVRATVKLVYKEK